MLQLFGLAMGRGLGGWGQVQLNAHNGQAELVEVRR